MKPRSILPSSPHALGEIVEEMDHLFQRQIELMRSEAFAGLTPAELEEYDKIGERIRCLFGELAKPK